MDWDTDVAGAGNPGGNLSRLTALGIVELLTHNWRGDKISIEATVGFPVKSTSIGKIFGIVIKQQKIQSWHMEMIVIVFKYLSILVHSRLWSYWNFKPLKVEIGWNTVSTGFPSKPIIEQGSEFPYLIFCIEFKKNSGKLTFVICICFTITTKSLWCTLYMIFTVHSVNPLKIFLLHRLHILSLK